MLTPQSTTLLLHFLEQLIAKSKVEVEEFDKRAAVGEILETNTDYVMARFKHRTLGRMHDFFEEGTQLELTDYILAWGHLSQLLETCPPEERPLIKSVMKELRAEVEGDEEENK